MAKNTQSTVPSFDEQLPRWVQVKGVEETKDGLRKIYSDTEARRRPGRILKVKDRAGRSHKFVQPAIRYERAIDPNGFLQALPVGTTHTGEDDPNVVSRKIMEKEVAGWLFIDRPPAYHDLKDDPAKRLERWHDHCRAQQEERIAEYNEQQRLAGRFYEDKQAAFFKQLGEAISENNRQAMSALTSDFKAGMKEILLETTKGR